MQTTAALAMEWVVIAFIAGLGAVVLYKIVMGHIDLSTVLQEMPDCTSGSGGGGGAGGGAPAAGAAAVGGGAAAAGGGAGGGAAGGGGAGGGGGGAGTAATPKASLSRLQMLLFTFVIAGLYLTLCLEAGELIAIPDQVLGLLGISGGSYVVSKGIQANK